MTMFDGVLRPPNWHDDAACAEIGTELFFPTPAQTMDFTRAARRVCHGTQERRGCPVIAPCRDAGVAEEFGMWGGLSAPQRRPARALVRKLLDVPVDEAVPRDWKERVAALPGSPDVLALTGCSLTPSVPAGNVIALRPHQERDEAA